MAWNLDSRKMFTQLHFQLAKFIWYFVKYIVEECRMLKISVDSN